MFYVITDRHVLESYHSKTSIGPISPISHAENVHPVSLYENENSEANKRPPLENSPANHLKQKKILQTYDHQTEDANTHPLLVESILSHPVVTLLEETLISDAKKKMHETGFRNFPVISPAGELVGIVSDRDLLLTAKTRVSEVMLTRVIGVNPKAPLRQLVAIMLQEKISAVPVVSPLRSVLGIVTTTDILKTILTHAPIEIWR
jgi:CBS domain-containing protein